MNNTIYRARILDFIDDPAKTGDDAVRFFENGALWVKDGHIVETGHADDILKKADSQTHIVDHTGKLIMPGFIDTHIHLPQTEMVAAYGEQLLEWLEQYAFPTEKKFSDYHYAEQVSTFFIDQLLMNGTTTALVFGTVHPESIDAFFTQAQKRQLRMSAGKVMMDRFCPTDLSDTPETSYQQSKQLIDKWHKKDRLLYAVTPRFAPTSSPEQLTQCARLLDEYPDVYLHTHLSENKKECQWVQSLFPESKNYLDVYDQAGLVRNRAVFAHGVQLDHEECATLANKNAALAHCPTSNLFLGSGLFNLHQCEQHNVKVGLGTDIGAGTSFSQLQTLNEAYKVQQLQGKPFSAYKGLYLATLGGARALSLEGTIGNFNTGCEADFVVIDFEATALTKFRHQHTHTLHEKLFALMMLGDDRAIYETYIMGQLAYQRTARKP